MYTHCITLFDVYRMVTKAIASHENNIYTYKKAIYTFSIGLPSLNIECNDVDNKKALLMCILFFYTFKRYLLKMVFK